MKNITKIILASFLGSASVAGAMLSTSTATADVSRPAVVELHFEDEYSAYAFYRLWVGGEGREWLEDHTDGLRYDFPSFDPDHRIEQSAVGETICYTTDCGI